MSCRMSIAFLFLAAACITCSSAADYCKDSIKKVDKCYTSVHVIGDRAFSRPKTLSAAESHCRRMKTNLKCVKEYAKCLRPLPKTMHNILYAGLKKEVTFRCKSEASRKEFVEQSDKTKDAKYKYDGIFFKLTNFYNYATTNLTDEQQLPYICCGYHYIIPEMFKTISTTTSVKSAKYFDRAIRNLWGDIIDFACGKFKDIDSCASQLPGSKEIYDQQSQTGNSGILIPLIRFTKTLE